jgi:hypothetical protein
VTWSDAEHGPLLGVLTDCEIARMAGIKKQAVWARRKRASIPAGPGRVYVPAETRRQMDEARAALLSAQDEAPTRAVEVFGRALSRECVTRLPAGACDVLRGAL